MATDSAFNVATHSAPQDTEPFEVPKVTKDKRKLLTAALQLILPDLQHDQRQEYSKAKHYKEAEHILATLFSLVTGPLEMDMRSDVLDNRGLALGMLVRHARKHKVTVPKSFTGDMGNIIRTHTLADLQGDVRWMGPW